MRKILKFTTSFVIFTFAAMVAYGDCERFYNPWYGAIGGTLGWQTETEHHFNNKFPNTDIRGSYDYSRAYGGNIAFGRDIKCFRAELEGGYRFYTISGLDSRATGLAELAAVSPEFNGLLTVIGVTPGPVTSLEPDQVAVLVESAIVSKVTIHDVTAIVNFFYDLPLCKGFSAYIGVGVGVGWFMGKKTGTGRRKEALGVVVTETEDFKVFATYIASQAMAGLSYALNPCVTLYSGYRIFISARPKYDFDLKVNDMSFSNNVEVGVRFRL